MIKTVLKFLILIVIIGTGITLLVWPHLPRLLYEGFPDERLPSASALTEITAAPEGTGLPDGQLLPPNAWAQQLFDERESAALLVAYNGQLRLEHYAAGADSDTMFNSYSMAKSLIGVLVLKAIADGKIDSLDDPIGQYLPERGDEAFKAVPIRQFMIMRSGVHFGTPDKPAAYAAAELKDRRYNPFGPMGRLHVTGLDGVNESLETSGDDRFDYQDVNTAILGDLLSHVYQQDLQDLLAEKIWHPAGAQAAQWRLYGPQLPVSPYCCIYATARDWLRVGLYLNQNGHDGEPFLPQALFDQWMGAEIRDEQAFNNAYGLHVYHNILDREGEPLQGRFTFMFGSRGQVVYMMPEQGFVVVRFGSMPSPLHSTLYSAWRSIHEEN